MANIGDMSIQLSADATPFEQGLANSMKTMEAFKASIGKVTNAASDIGKTLQSKVNAAASFNQFNNGINKVRGQMDALKGSIKEAFMNMPGGAMLGPIGMAVDAYKTLFNAAKAFANDQMFDKIRASNKLANRYGVDTRSYSGLQYAAERVGVGSEGLDFAMQKIAILSGKVGMGVRDAKDELRMFGLDAETFARLPMDDQLLKMSEAFQKMPNAATRAAAAVRLFGKAGVEMLPLLEAGPDKLREYRQEAERLGLTYTPEDAARASAAKLAFKKIDFAYEGAKQRTMLAAQPAVTWFADYIGKSAEGFARLFGRDPSAEYNSRAQGAGNNEEVTHRVRELTLAYELQAATIGKTARQAELLTLAIRDGASAKDLLPAKIAAERAGYLEEVTRIQRAMDAIFHSRIQNYREELNRRGVGLGFQGDLVQKERVLMVEEYAKALKDQFDAIGRTADEMAILKLRREGVAESELKGLRVVQEAIRIRKLEQDILTRQNAADMFSHARVYEDKLSEVDDPKQKDRLRALMVNADVLERVASLREKVATFGMSEREIDLWKFKDLGEMDKNIKNLDAWHRQLESMQLTKQIQDADPLERFKQRVKEIQELKQSGFLSDAIFGKALQQQSRDLLSGANLPGYRNQEALIRGSSAEVSAVIRSKRPEEKLADQLKEAMRVLQEQGKNQEKLQRDILDFLKENGLKVVDLP